MPAAGVCRVQLEWKYSDDPWAQEVAVNTLHLQTRSGSNSAPIDPQYVADQISGKFVTAWPTISALHSSKIRLSGFKVYQLDAAGHAESAGFHDATAAALTGGGISGMMPPEVALCLSYAAYPPGGFTAQKGRKRGRIYLPGINQGKCNADGLFDLDGNTGILNGWRDLINAINQIPAHAGSTDLMGVVVYSRSGLSTYDALYWHWDNHFDMQRRRQDQATPQRAAVTVDGWV